MGALYDKLIELEEFSTRECVITIRIKEKEQAEIYAENCRKIISCDNEFITLGICGAEVRISGTPLILENFGINGVKITGKICSVDFSQSGAENLVNQNEK